MIRVLVSACLLGEPVRYNGTGKQVSSPILRNWQQAGRIVSICPEVAGGLPVPRNPAEIVQGEGKDVLTGEAAVVEKSGRVVSDYFIAGAQKALESAQTHQILLAVLKEGSPSCGSGSIYSGHFDGTRLSGMGVTARYLSQHGIRLFNEHQLREANHYLRRLELD